ncbi:hypothetical protein ACS0TY_011468 [Phlomoides rotata]
MEGGLFGLVAARKRVGLLDQVAARTRASLLGQGLARPIDTRTRPARPMPTRTGAVRPWPPLARLWSVMGVWTSPCTTMIGLARPYGGLLAHIGFSRPSFKGFAVSRRSVETEHQKVEGWL